MCSLPVISCTCSILVKHLFIFIILLYSRFILVDVGDSGHHSDGGVLANSSFGQALEVQYQTLVAFLVREYAYVKFYVIIFLLIFAGEGDRVFPFVISGDEAFTLRRI